MRRSSSSRLARLWARSRRTTSGSVNCHLLHTGTISRLAATVVVVIGIVALGIAMVVPVSSSSDAPSLTSVSAKRDGIALQWSAPSTNLTIVGYAISRSSSGGDNTFQEIVSDTGSTATSYRDRSVSSAEVEKRDSGTLWSYKVKALLESSDGTSSETGWSDKRNLVLPVFPRPGSLSYDIDEDDKELTLTWTAPTLSWSNQALPQTGYAIYRTAYNSWGSADNVVSFVGTTGVNTLTYTEDIPSIDDSPNGYRYEIRATYGIWLSWEQYVVYTGD
ncbi:MAG: hypothetical protein F4Y11_08875 [Chloroflexi bacterium]|nr:hypothetical protein [Chloroflexota bacterium]